MKTIFGYLGFGSALILTFIDFGTSYAGIQALISPEATSIVVRVLPFVMAGLALSFNATSSYLLVMFQTKGFTKFSQWFLICAWMGFLIFDGVSSWIGMIYAVSGVEMLTDGGMTKAFESLNEAQLGLATVVSILATFGPFLATVFWDLSEEDAGQSFSAMFARPQ